MPSETRIDIPLRRKRKIVSSENNVLTWKTGNAMATEDTYALCRCGHSGDKPLCDGTHREIGFREEAPVQADGGNTS